MVEEDIQKTEEQLKAAESKAKDQKQKKKTSIDDKNMLDLQDVDEEQEEQQDLVEDYQRFLENRQELAAL